MSPSNSTSIKTGAGVATLALAFDLDGPTGDAMLTGALWRKPGYFCQGAYGPHRAAPRILDMLAATGLQATFFTPSWVVEQWPDLCRRIVEEGHEMANHGHRHEVFYALSEEEQRDVIEQSQRIFFQELGLTAVGFRAPSGDWHPNTARLLEEAGFEYSSSMRNGDEPYRHDAGALIEIPAKSLFDDYTRFAYQRSPNFPSGLDRVADYRDSFQTWRDEIEAAKDLELTVPTIWHPKVIGTPGRALMLESFLEDISADDRIAVRTCVDIARSWKERNPT